jgi:putative FmdB family regulatory protein
MPIFEFTCNQCQNGRKFSVLVGVVANAKPPTCPKCGSTEVTKLISRFARIRSDDDAIDALADAADNTDLEDPKAMRRLMRDVASEMGEDADGAEFADAMEAEFENEMSGKPSSIDD